MPSQRAIAIATAQAEKWAKHRDKPIRNKNAEGTTRQAVESGPEDSEHPIHVVPNPEDGGWLVIQEKKRLAQGKDKGDVLNKAREKAKASHVLLCIHDSSGTLVDEEDY
ncbi:MAG: DUF2188 domain-containing protein [Leptolyngbyaceae bacterium]|nr:DUF2188 domain-containing protein [Leptolyngbyaceae bacterium]